jgi:hypothetical protein
VLPAVGWSGRWRTWGSDLLPATGLLAPIPYQGQMWARDAAPLTDGSAHK